MKRIFLLFIFSIFNSWSADKNLKVDQVMSAQTSDRSYFDSNEIKRLKENMDILKPILEDSQQQIDKLNRQIETVRETGNRSRLEDLQSSKEINQRSLSGIRNLYDLLDTYSNIAEDINLRHEYVNEVSFRNKENLLNKINKGVEYLSQIDIEQMINLNFKYIDSGHIGLGADIGQKISNAFFEAGIDLDDIARQAKEFNKNLLEFEFKHVGGLKQIEIKSY